MVELSKEEFQELLKQSIEGAVAPLKGEITKAILTAMKEQETLPPPEKKLEDTVTEPETDKAVIAKILGIQQKIDERQNKLWPKVDETDPERQKLRAEMEALYAEKDAVLKTITIKAPAVAEKAPAVAEPGLVEARKEIVDLKAKVADAEKKLGEAKAETLTLAKTVEAQIPQNEGLRFFNPAARRVVEDIKRTLLPFKESK